MVGRGSGGRLEICLNLPDAPVRGRLQPGGGMVARKVRIGADGELDDELTAWLRETYERS